MCVCVWAEGPLSVAGYPLRVPKWGTYENPTRKRRVKERRRGGRFDLLSSCETCGTFCPEDTQVVLIQGLVQDDQAQPLLSCKKKRKKDETNVWCQSRGHKKNTLRAKWFQIILGDSSGNYPSWTSDVPNNGDKNKQWRTTGRSSSPGGKLRNSCDD